jgi:hypothetical protein
MSLTGRKQMLRKCLGLLVGSTLMMVQSPGFAAAQPGSAASPLALFQSVCTKGGSSLKKDEAKALPFKKLPANAKKALESTSMLRYTPAKSVENTVYQVGGRKGFYLLLPRSGSPGDADPYFGSCAVIWRGEDYSEAKRMIMPHPDPAWLKGTLPSDNSIGFAHSATDDGDLQLSVGAFSGWTALRSAPSTRTPIETDSGGDPRP